MRITTDFNLAPNVRYQLTLWFSDYDYAGLLQLLPLNDTYHRFYRAVPLPSTKPAGPLTVTVWTTETAPVPVDFRFIPALSSEAKTARPHFFSYQLTP
ncbi:MAG: hypothetical protein H7343_16915 [Undibacterium sp.]|nr:hypothetical protein [Opitutaceae bacterium]